MTGPDREPPPLGLCLALPSVWAFTESAPTLDLTCSASPVSTSQLSCPTLLSFLPNRRIKKALVPQRRDRIQIICNENTLNQANKADALSARLIISTSALDISLLRDMSAGKLPKVLTSHCLGVRGGGRGPGLSASTHDQPKMRKRTLRARTPRLHFRLGRDLTG